MRCARLEPRRHRLVAGVWFGNDDNSPMNKVTGGGLPARTWHNFMLEATRGEPIRPLPTGAAVVASTGGGDRSGSGLGSWLSRLFGGGSSRSSGTDKSGR